MAFSSITTGLTTLNDVIDDIRDFAIARGWTQEQDVDPTAAEVNGTFTTTGRNLWLSIVPSSSDYIAHGGIRSPDPDRIYVGMRSISTLGSIGNGIQTHVTGLPPVSGFSDSPKFNPFFDGMGTLADRYSWTDALGNSTPPASEVNQAGPYTRLLLFGPDDTSPLGLTPNYIYWVLEFTPGRFTHGGFGQFGKFNKWLGGWGSLCHARRTSNSVDNLNNATMWNDQVRESSKEASWVMAADVGQRANAATVSPLGRVRWFQKATESDMNGGVTDFEAFAMHIGGTVTYRDLITNSPGAVVLSGFTQLITPFMSLANVGPSDGPVDSDLNMMPAAFPIDMFLGNITPFEPGVEVTIGGIAIVPIPFTSKLAGSPNSNYGGIFYRKRV